MWGRKMCYLSNCSFKIYKRIKILSKTVATQKNQKEKRNTINPKKKLNWKDETKKHEFDQQTEKSRHR